MKLAFVTPRYGSDIVGGAERLVRDFATRLAATGDDVEVLTTCARSLFTWANELPAGEISDAGVRVRRFPVTVASDRHLLGRLQPVIDAGIELPDELADEWLRQSGLSEPLLAAIDEAAGRVDAILFAPYWVANTVFGASRQPDKSIVISCLHDEAYARFTSVRRTLRGVAGLICNSDGEAELATSLLGEATRLRVVGVGFDAVDAVHGTPNPDVIAYAGRQEEPKRFPLLVEWVVAYNDHLRGEHAPLTLVAMGTSAWSAPARGAAVVRDLGFVDEDTKFATLRTALAVANLSRNESFSYVVMEAWLAGRPVIVQSDATVTRRHCEASGGGLWVASAEEFAEAIGRLRADPAAAAAMGRSGRRYVESLYSWPAVLTRMHDAVASLAS